MQLCCVQYNAKCVAVFGQGNKVFKEHWKNLGGKFNPRLKLPQEGEEGGEVQRGPGWIFQLKKKEAVETLLAQIQEGTVQQSPSSSSSSSSKKRKRAPQKKKEMKKEMKKETKQDDSDEENLCKVCFERDIDCVFLPCGHLASCQTCAAEVNRCIICRQVITESKPIFRA